MAATPARTPTRTPTPARALLALLVALAVPRDDGPGAAWGAPAERGPGAGRACISVSAPLQGGLSNSLAFVNTGMAFADGLRRTWPSPAAPLWVFPPYFRPQSSHGQAKAAFDDLFAAQQGAVVLEAHEVGVPAIHDAVRCQALDAVPPAEILALQDVYPYFNANHARCPPELMGVADPASPGGFIRIADPRFPEVAAHALASDVRAAGPSKAPAEYAACQYVVALPGRLLAYHHNYSVSWAALLDRYLAGGTGEPNREVFARVIAPSKPVVVAVHHRLGDVDEWLRSDNEKHHGRSVREKRMSVQWPIFCLAVLFELVAAPESCISVHVYTDGTAASPDVGALRAFATSAGVDVHVHGMDEKPPFGPRLTLDAMAHADVLVVGGSGFGRVAALLAAGIVVAPPTYKDFHPLAYLPRVVEAGEALPWFWEWQSPVNPAALAALARSSPLGRQMQHRLYQFVSRSASEVGQRCRLVAPALPASDAGAARAGANKPWPLNQREPGFRPRQPGDAEGGALDGEGVGDEGQGGSGGGPGNAVMFLRVCVLGLVLGLLFACRHRLGLARYFRSQHPPPR